LTEQFKKINKNSNLNKKIDFNLNDLSNSSNQEQYEDFYCNDETEKCDICLKPCKNKLGVAIHKGKSHQKIKFKTIYI
jgi:hypothetical protein